MLLSEATKPANGGYQRLLRPRNQNLLSESSESNSQSTTDHLRILSLHDKAYHLFCIVVHILFFFQVRPQQCQRRPQK
jgi:hypothetical protein